jgi:hypothetical protein
MRGALAARLSEADCQPPIAGSRSSWPVRTQGGGGRTSDPQRLTAASRQPTA